MSALENDPWRLGHRRPWWQWNVITLMVALFVLVWLRELSNMDYYVAWLWCAIVLSAWLLFPFFREAGKAIGTGRVESPPWPLSQRQRFVRFVAYALLVLAWTMLAFVGLMGE